MIEHWLTQFLTGLAVGIVSGVVLCTGLVMGVVAIACGIEWYMRQGRESEESWREDISEDTLGVSYANND